MKYKQLAYKATTENGEYYAQWFQDCHLWRIKLDIGGRRSTLQLSSLEKRVQERHYNKRQDKKEEEALTALWDALRPLGFTKSGSIKV
jgi:hypothetical protein|tara:strand:- start:494 stop:757 length:264 start_codon:yes stop_codon:yes gene_type:complete